MTYALHLLIYLSVYTMIALSLNLIVGYCGRFTLAHGAYFAAGAYTYALATIVLRWNTLLALLLAVFVGAVLSSGLSLAAPRMRDDFFVIESLAVQVLLFSMLYNWSSTEARLGTWRNMTNGPSGIGGIPSPRILGTTIESLGGISCIAIVVMGLSFLLVWLLVSSPWGRLLLAVRDDHVVVRGLGKNPFLIESEVFGIACAIAALAGAVYAIYVGYIDPSIGSLDQSILMLSMVVVGGAGNLMGPVVGAALLVLIPELLALLRIPGPLAANLRLALYGLLLVIMVHLRPQGVAGKYRVE